MPELPEVETVCRSLRQHLLSLKIDDVDVRLPRLIKYPSPESFRDDLRGRMILAIERRGKYLLFRLSGDYTLVIHLRMTGQLRYSLPEEDLPKHTHVVFLLSNGRELRFTDVRQFGMLFLASDDQIERVAGLDRLGHEPLDAFPEAEFRALLAGRKTKIKSFLLDQRHVVGVGNIYADESLFAAGIHPERPAGDLSSQEAADLHRELVRILQAGVAMQGTSFSDYVDGLGQKGSFQYQLRVYGRKGQACTFCGAVIERIVVAGRSSHICPLCQKL